MTSALDRLLQRQDLSQREAEDLLTALTDEACPPAFAGAVLAALRVKGETPDEVRGFATAMRRLARRPAIDAQTAAVDVVGTGGDSSHSLNLSTGAAVLASACGQPVAKHGNRAVSSRSGSADVLEALGYEIPGDGHAAARCLDETGFTFLFAPVFHPAMKALAPVRRSLGVRTVFNLLGPLTNPAEPPYMVIGTFDRTSAALMAETLAAMPIERAFVVHGASGWDEPTPAGPFLLHDVRPGHIRRRDVDPREVGLDRCRIEDLRGADPAQNARRLEAALMGGTEEPADGDAGAHRDALVLGAALALKVTGRARALRDGVAMARDAIKSGAARRQLEKLRSFRNGAGGGDHV